MFENIIKFKAIKEYVENNQKYLPVPIKVNIPKWFKELEHNIGGKTVKGCIPFLDTLTTGYLLKMPVDYHIQHNREYNNEIKTGMESGTPKESSGEEINLNYGQPEFHPTMQLGNSPYVEKNKNLPIHKILNPWIIETPPGYSTLFLPPLNNTDDRFSIIPGIVDTDSFPNEINLPFIVNGDKYPHLKTTIKIGTPYVQVIPFKRESWKMKIQCEDKKKKNLRRLFSFRHVIHNYKQLFWYKKSWK